jgi:hypothetical protein
LEYKVVKAIFSINKIREEEIEQIELDTSDMEFEGVSLETATDIKKDAIDIQKDANPLFKNPDSKNNDEKVKIRV